MVLIVENPSQARHFTFKAPGKGGKGEICSCKEGIAKLKPYLEKDMSNMFQIVSQKIFPCSKSSGSKPSGAEEQEPQAGSNPLSHQLKLYLPGAYQYMANMAKSAEELMRQQIMIHTMVDSIESKSTSLGNAPDFAIRRAYLQQRATQETLAGVAAQKLIAMKNVIEALIYAAFIFLLPLAMLPFGWRFIANWGSLLLWINLWPPLYAVLNYIVMAASQAKGMGIVSSEGVTIANSVGFLDFHADVAAQAGYMSIAVGSLAYAIVKSGISGFSYLAGHLGGPSTNAAGRAAEEMLSGNYSFGNITQGVMQANNSTFGQQMLSPSYSSGSFAQNDGIISRNSSASGEHVVSVASSSLRSSVNWSESMSNNYTEQATEATQMAENKAKAAAQSEGDAIRNILDLSAHQAKQHSSSDGYTNTDAINENKGLTKLNTLVDRFAKEQGITREKAALYLSRTAVSGQIGTGPIAKLLGASFSLSEEGSAQFSKNNIDRKAFSAAQDFSKQSSFQEALQESITAARDMRYSTLDDEGKRYVSSFNSAEERANNLRTEASVHLNQSESYSEMASWTKQNAGAINANLNQEYVNWLQNQNLPNSKGVMGLHEAETIVSSRPDLDLLYQRRFLEDRMKNAESFMSFRRGEVMQDYHTASEKITLPSSTSSNQQVIQTAEEQGFGKGFSVDPTAKNQVQEKINNAQAQIQAAQNSVNATGSQMQQMISNKVK